MPPSTNRAAVYSALVSARKACRACSGLCNPAAYDGGRYDCNHIGLWSLWQGNLNADLLVVGQDWGDTAYFARNGGHDSAVQTNETLRVLLADIGINIARPGPHDSGGGVAFFTNVILCLKQGGMQAIIQSEWAQNCASRFLKPTIDLISPKIVVTLGEQAYRAMQNLYSLPRLGFRQAVDRQDGFRIGPATEYFPMYHCGARILNTHRPLEQQRRDWKRIERALAARG